MPTKIIEKAGPNTRVELGDVVRDDVMGFEGMVEAITVWRFGCRRIQVRPTTLKAGAPQEPQVFDEPALHIVKRAKVPTKAASRAQGGPKEPAMERLALSRN